MDMELFRHNHARFIAMSLVDPKFLEGNLAVFNHTEFVEHIMREWAISMSDNKNLKIVNAFFHHEMHLYVKVGLKRHQLC